MLFTIVAIWAVVIPVAVLAISWRAPDRREARKAQSNESVSTREPRTAVSPRAHRAVRRSRTSARRTCPELAGDARRRPTSA